jgi:SsrA-binding protein
MKSLAMNKKARADYAIEDTIEAGLVLTGREVKSAKTGGAQLTGSYARIIQNEAHLINGLIRPYSHAPSDPSYDERRSRKLLLHRAEIEKIQRRDLEKGLSLIPLELYVRKGKIKVSLGIGRPKKKYDKRETIKKRETEREIRRAVKKN